MFFVGNVLDAKPIIYNLKPYVTHTTNITTYSNYPIATKSTLINNSISGNNTLYNNTFIVSYSDYKAFG